MLHSPGHTHTHKQVHEISRSFDALHAKTVCVREELAGIRGEITGLREDFHGMNKKLDAVLS